jgi:hypothetical protein
MTSQDADYTTTTTTTATTTAAKLHIYKRQMNGYFIGYMKHKNRSAKHKRKFM